LLTRRWQVDHAAFQDRDLSDRDSVHLWADGVPPTVRLSQAHSCVLVLLGVRLDGAVIRATVAPVRVAGPRA
ncbi:hypothetical protein ACFV0Q_36625, partial [Streptomyces sp. NPDC059564]